MPVTHRSKNLETIPTPDPPTAQQPKKQDRKLKAATSAESGLLLPPQSAAQSPQKWGHKPKATTSADSRSLPLQSAAQSPQKRGRKRTEATTDTETKPLWKRTKSSSVKAPLPNWDALPACSVRNDYPAVKANLIPPTWRTSKQVAAEREAFQRAVKEKVKQAKAAMRLLAEMEVDEELVDEDIEIVCCLSGVDELHR